MSNPSMKELQEAYEWRKGLEELGILSEVEDAIVRIVEDLDIDEEEINKIF